jgi:hypothetical protein
MFKTVASAVGLHAHRRILDFGLPILDWKTFQSQIQNLKSKIALGGLKGIQTLTKSVQDFYAVRLHHQPENKIGVEGGIFTRTSLVLTRQRVEFLVRLIIPPLRRKKYKIPTVRFELTSTGF